MISTRVLLMSMNRLKESKWQSLQRSQPSPALRASQIDSLGRPITSMRKRQGCTALMLSALGHLRQARAS